MIETLQKSNSINLFKRQVNTLLSLKNTPQTAISKAFYFAEICFTL